MFDGLYAGTTSTPLGRPNMPRRIWRARLCRSDPLPSDASDWMDSLTRYDAPREQGHSNFYAVVNSGAEKGLVFGAHPRHGRSDMTVEKVAATAAADDECVECGYEPELKRTLGSFQIFAISFAFISVAVGIFATYDGVLLACGPGGMLVWV